MKEKDKTRCIKFYCRECNKEMWRGVKLKGNNDTIDFAYHMLICSDCMIARAKEAQ